PLAPHGNQTPALAGSPATLSCRRPPRRAGPAPGSDRPVPQPATGPAPPARFAGHAIRARDDCWTSATATQRTHEMPRIKPDLTARRSRQASEPTPEQVLNKTTPW